MKSVGDIEHELKSKEAPAHPLLRGGAIDGALGGVCPYNISLSSHHSQHTPATSTDPLTPSREGKPRNEPC